MELRQLVYFVAVAEAKHMRRAAERLHLSQPPLSRQIQQLEEELGVLLFNRTTRGMEITVAGEQLLRYARSIQTLVSQAEEQTRRAGLGQSGRLDIGVYGSAVFGLVPKVLTTFRSQYPDVELVLHHAQTPVQLPALRQGLVMLVFERLLPTEPDVEIELVAREELMLALPEFHPLAQRKSVDVQALRDERIIIGSSPSAAATALEICRAHGFEPRFLPPASDVVTATLLAATGAGVTLVPSSMTNVLYPGIVYRPLHSRVEAYMDLHCFYLKGAASPLLDAMLKTVRGFRAGHASGRKRTAKAASA